MRQPIRLACRWTGCPTEACFPAGRRLGRAVTVFTVIPAATPTPSRGCRRRPTRCRWRSPSPSWSVRAGEVRFRRRQQADRVRARDVAIVVGRTSTGCQRAGPSDVAVGPEVPWNGLCAIVLDIRFAPRVDVERDSVIQVGRMFDGGQRVARGSRGQRDGAHRRTGERPREKNGFHRNLQS